MDVVRACVVHACVPARARVWQCARAGLTTFAPFVRSCVRSQVRGFDHVSQAAGYEPFKFEDVNTGMLIDIAGLHIEPVVGKGFYCWGPKKEVRGCC